MDSITKTPLFGILITLIFYKFGTYLHDKFKTPLINPMVVAVFGIIAVLAILDIPLANYKIGADTISMFAAPAIACIGVNIYKKREMLRNNLIPILVGSFVGSLTSIVSVILLCKVFNLDTILMKSTIAKSVTVPMASDITTQIGGIVPVSIIAVVISGMFFAVFSPILIKIFKIKGDVAKGMAIGTCGHSLGTSTAIKMGKDIGTVSGIAIGGAGVMTFSIITILTMVYG